MGAKDTSGCIERFGTRYAGVFPFFETVVQHYDASLQVILDRIAGKVTSDAEIEAFTNNTPSLSKPLEERKLDYIQLGGGKQPESQSSVSFVSTSKVVIAEHVSSRLSLQLTVSLQVTKSISRFLARSRARNDFSNRGEFLQTLADKNRASTSEILAPTVDSSSTSKGTDMQEHSSCARVDAKTIDRANQIKYDIMKNEDGPLTRISSTEVPLSDSSVNAQGLPESATIASSSIPRRSSLQGESPLHPRKRRRLADVEESTKDSSSQIPPTVQNETDGISAALVPAIDERIQNIEEHLSLRYGMDRLLRLNRKC